MKQSPASRKWLREASLQRISQQMKNKTETIVGANKLKLSLSSVSNLEPSGLSPFECGQLLIWVEGKELHPAVLDTMRRSVERRRAAFLGEYSALCCILCLAFSARCVQPSDSSFSLLVLRF